MFANALQHDEFAIVTVIMLVVHGYITTACAACKQTLADIQPVDSKADSDCTETSQRPHQVQAYPTSADKHSRCDSQAPKLVAVGKGEQEF